MSEPITTVPTVPGPAGYPVITDISPDPPEDTVTEHDETTERLGRALGWASLGLGLSMTFAPRAVTKISGVDDSATARLMTRIVGLRELLHAVALLTGPPEWVWTRVAGDAMDLPALLIATARRHGTRRMRGVMATAAVAGITAADVYTALRTLQEDTAKAGHPAKKNGALHLEASVTINRPPEEAYTYWHDFTHLPEFMVHVDDVQVTGDRSMHWKAEMHPLHKTIEWDAEIVEDRPNELISWRSTDGSDVPNSGSVHFDPAPGGRGTEVRVEMEYAPPGGRAGIAVAKLMGEAPDQQVRDDLRRFKQVMEIGEIVRSEGSPEGTHTQRLLRQRAAQPLP
jgi:uncharacterized membrane protein